MNDQIIWKPTEAEIMKMIDACSHARLELWHQRDDYPEVIEGLLMAKHLMRQILAEDYDD